MAIVLHIWRICSTEHFINMCLNKIKPTPQLAFWLIAVTCAILFILPAIMALPGWDFFNMSKEETARIGDSIGGMTAPFVAILASVLTFMAFWVQYDFNEKQQASIEQERFEHNFYEMLNIHESITQSLRLEIVDEGAGVGTENRVVASREGRDVFQLLYELLPISANIGVANGFILLNSQQYMGLRDLFKNGGDHRFEFYEKNNEVGKLDHYYRQLYCLFKMIEDNKKLDDDGKCEYARIVCSTLSQYELVLLFYNGLSLHGKEKFKPMIEDYAVMNNLRKELLAIADDERLYSPRAYQRN